MGNCRPWSVQTCPVSGPDPNGLTYTILLEKNFGGVQLQVQYVGLPVRRRNAAWGRRHNICPKSALYRAFPPTLFKASIWYLPQNQSLHALQTQAKKMTEAVLEQDIQNMMRRGGEKIKGKKKTSQPSKRHLSVSLLLSFPCSVISVLL